ncbi:MAG: hypothetical protein HOE30_00165 [Deltaproteobacteria bacterium]|jgi:hypothetical protein|nr:hypothetical protein [Deltaproteobacteria bacterium]MBT4384350.1 hypothetical protein [Candidatus Peregrinibacteria bacterium]MBT4632274.1 hypothetical protein [Candidatus Peregrinibacteria bacterium]MBT5516620.1 hypothetical protein [Candidatus Peregrinibacteria bacterium]MBT5824315.1 hypothetical protein [Candidatus Peregrinibacteria bacterium]
MKKADLKSYLCLSSTLFLLVGSFHLVRVIAHWEMMIDGLLIPEWVSLVAFGLTFSLAWAGFHWKKNS